MHQHFATHGDAFGTFLRVPTWNPCGKTGSAEMKYSAHKPDWFLFTVILALTMSGIVMVFSASSVLAADRFGSPYYYFLRQLLWVCAGFAACGILMVADLQRLRSFIFPLLFSSFLLMALVAVPGVGKSIGGARRWFDLGPFSFQPSELFKFLWVLYLSDSLNRRRDKLGTLSGYLPYFLLLGVALFLLEMQHDFGSAVLLVAMSLVLFFLSGMKIGHLAAPLIVLTPLFFFLIQSVGYRMRRVTAFLDPWQDPQGAGFQLVQSLIAVGSGGPFGVGLSNSTQKLFYLPAPHTDFIFAILAEETGFLGATLVLLLFVIFFLRGLRLASQLLAQSDRFFEALLAAGLTLLVAGQAFVNIAVVLGLLPTKGLPLPFLSYGGSSLFFTLSACGVLLNLSRLTLMPSAWWTPPVEARGAALWEKSAWKNR